MYMFMSKRCRKYSDWSCFVLSEHTLNFGPGKASRSACPMELEKEKPDLKVLAYRAYKVLKRKPK